jgi:hypothetical protein
MARLLRRLLVIALFGVAVGAAVRALQARRLVAPAPDAGPSWPPLPPVEPEPAAVAVGAGWVEPVDGRCPDGYPVKANRSGIFHVPGGQFYERTVPERCYADPQAAEADGYRPARR